jgi:hypothetical protein
MPLLNSSFSMNSEPVVLGRTEARIATPPLRELTPETSYGFAVIDFARDFLKRPLDPWQEWLVIRLGELLPDGRPRFRRALVLVARQNGKTELLVILTLFWMFVENVPLILSTSTTLAYAKESWQKALNLIEDNRVLNALVADVCRATGAQYIQTVHGSQYRFAAANSKAGRSLTVHRFVADELREHRSWDAWNAAYYAMQAVPTAQAIAITNQGDDKSIVLDSLREAALSFSDPRLGIFEWSAPDGADVIDPEAIAYANPNLGRRIFLEDVIGAATLAKAKGGPELAGFKTEVLCQRVRMLDPAINLDKWNANVDTDFDLAEIRSRVALCVDVSLDGLHATLNAAGRLDNGRIGVEVVRAFDGANCIAEARAMLPSILKQVKPRLFGWFPTGPAAGLGADLTARTGLIPPGVKVVAIGTEMPSACMGFAEQVQSDEIMHPDDALLNAHLAAAERYWTGDRWVFTRRGAGHCDAAYAAAGAVHLVRTQPVVGLPRIILPSED